MTTLEERLFDDAPCGYAVCDASGTVVLANRELLGLLGREAAEVVGRSRLPDLVTVGGRMYFETHLFPLLELEGSVREVAVELSRADGERVPVLLSANVVVEGGAVTGLRVVVIEARHRRRYEADLLEAVHEREEARRRSAELAHTLQQTLIPPRPPHVEGLEIAAAYRPAGDGDEVGGDFFDVFQVAPDEWVVVVGDVLGKGVPAATVTAFVRHTVRELAMRSPDPADVLSELDAELERHPSGKFCTLALLRLRADGASWSVTGAVGGHPLPLVRSPSGSVTTPGVHGPLVGAAMRIPFTSYRHELGDDVVVLYTDGVTEARRGRTMFGEDRLEELVAAAEPDVDGLVEGVVQEVLAYQEGYADDDIVVVALRAAGRSPA